MNKKFCFEVKIVFNFKVPNNSQIFNKTSTYRVVTDSKDDAIDTAIYLNRTEYGDTIGYQYKACAIIDKKVVYVLNR